MSEISTNVATHDLLKSHPVYRRILANLGSYVEAHSPLDLESRQTFLDRIKDIFKEEGCLLTKIYHFTGGPDRPLSFIPNMDSFYALTKNEYYKILTTQPSVVNQSYWEFRPVNDQSVDFQFMTVKVRNVMNFLSSTHTVDVYFFWLTFDLPISLTQLK